MNTISMTRRVRGALAGTACALAVAVPATAWPAAPAAAFDGEHQIISRTGVCLEIDHARGWNGAPAAVDWCSRRGDNQYWTLEPAPGGDGYYRIRVRHSRRCLDVRAVSYDDGAQLTQWDCHDGGNQQWKLIDARNGYYKIVARHSGKCLDRAGWNVVQWNCHDVNWQRWRLG